jgi:hypothetical protein
MLGSAAGAAVCATAALAQAAMAEAINKLRNFSIRTPYKNLSTAHSKPAAPGTENQESAVAGKYAMRMQNRLSIDRALKRKVQC